MGTSTSQIQRLVLTWFWNWTTVSLSVPAVRRVALSVLRNQKWKIPRWSEDDMLPSWCWCRMRERYTNRLGNGKRWFSKKNIKWLGVLPAGGPHVFWEFICRTNWNDVVCCVYSFVRLFVFTNELQDNHESAHFALAYKLATGKWHGTRYTGGRRSSFTFRLSSVASMGTNFIHCTIPPTFFLL